MRHIKSVSVTYDDDTTEAFEGVGVSNVITSAAPADVKSGYPAREYRYLSLTLSLPIPKEPTPDGE